MATDILNKIVKFLGSHEHEQVSRLVMLDLFVSSGLITVFAVRAFLAATGYPQIGNDTLHIAHMLWGGFLLAAVTLYLGLAKNPLKTLSIILGGIGFGLFIDELGKFITNDNNYFFKPAAGLIILSFVILWFGVRWLIVRADHVDFIPPAVWPRNRWLNVLFWAWLLVEIGVSLAAAAIIWIRPETVGDSPGPHWLVITFYVLYVLGLLAGMVTLKTKSRDKAADVIRFAVLFSIVTVYPFQFYREQFSASIDFIISICVILALTKLSKD